MAEAEAAETQVWIEFAVKCEYLDVEQGRELYGIYNQILGGLVNMINNRRKMDFVNKLSPVSKSPSLHISTNK